MPKPESDTTPDGVMRIQGYDPIPAFARALNNQGKEEYNTVHLEDYRFTIKKLPYGDAIISIGGKELLIPRFDNICSQLCGWLRERS